MVHSHNGEYQKGILEYNTFTGRTRILLSPVQQTPNSQSFSKKPLHRWCNSLDSLQLVITKELLYNNYRFVYVHVPHP